MTTTDVRLKRAKEGKLRDSMSKNMVPTLDMAAVSEGSVSGTYSEKAGLVTDRSNC